MANKLVDLSRRVYRVLLPENKYEETSEISNSKIHMRVRKNGTGTVTLSRALCAFDISRKLFLLNIRVRHIFNFSFESIN